MSVLDLPHNRKVILYVLGTLEDLKARGLIEGGKLVPTPKGLAGFDQLQASGFRPTVEEIRSVMRHLQNR